MPELLTQNYREQLATWIGKTCHFRLLYKISRDGCSAQTFHQKCDGQGPTVTVLYNTNNTIYGGYLSQSWNSNGGYINDPYACLFRLQYNGSSNPLKFQITKTANAGYGDSNNGPTFGGGHDLKTFTGTIIKSGNVFSLNGYVQNIGNSYNLNGQNANSVTNNNMKVTDLEVYLVQDGPGPRNLDKPWRDDSEWTSEKAQELKENLIDYKPVTEAKTTAANILLIGQIGAGKSSFFNSVNSIFRGKITSKACSGSFEHSVTTCYRQYTVKDFSSGKFLNFRLCDTRGFEEELALDAEEISFALDGHVPDRYQFNPMVPFTTDTPGFVRVPKLRDKIHCVAFVVDGSTVDVLSDKTRKQLKDLQIRMNHKNVPQVVLLTKLDKICPEVEEDVTNTFSSSSISHAVEKVAEMMGLPRAHVLPVKNYESERKLKNGVDILLMEALQRCLDFADDFIDEQLDSLALEEKTIKDRD
ncbi:interferon-induced protein 44-like isoform X2 [Ostrea edulis]|uniref:interferon-induced protein 44-like isoform X2 n=1 Tax=Ostrea edulis TaxID=37623 RepID=UPI0024AEC7BC|nr:interferon-induced protein 44-like isoform X2 [Ostrea edulis]XP_056000059.1 interferon-induced protein 44-like isoform X2 [Ostrea edulis]